MAIPSPFLKESRGLYEWAAHFSKRFPSLVNSRLVRGVSVILGSTAPTFLEKRSTLHLKRLLLTHFFLCTSIERAIKQRLKEPLYVRIFSVHSRLCVAVTYAQGKGTSFSSEAILEIASQKVPALERIALSSYHLICQEFPYALYYVELEKRRGAPLTPHETRHLESYLKEELSPYILEPSLFWPYNHEEAFKQLLILEKEVSSKKDAPQVIIRFQRQTSQELEFLIYLVRPQETISSATAITADHFPPSIKLISYLKQEINSRIPTLAEAFSLTFPIHNFKTRERVNLLQAREFVAKLLRDVFEVFRDYNGGLFETQKGQFDQLSKAFSKKIPNFSLFGKDLFYSLLPIEAQICLAPSLLEKLFMGFSQSLVKKDSLTQPNPHVLILQPDAHLLSPWLDQAKSLHEEGTITAYAHFKLLSQTYLCLVEETGQALEKIKLSHFQTLTSPKPKRLLRLSFQAGPIFSFYPHYLAKEVRGRTVAKLLFEGLFRLKPQRGVECAGCQNFTLSKNKKRYLFELRTHHWSNGQQVTAYDYEKTWRRNVLAKESLNPFYILKHAESIRKKEKSIQALGVAAMSDYLLQVDLEQEDPHFLKKLSHPSFFPSLSDYFETTSFNGPYCIREKDKDQLILEKNPYYWDKESLFFEGVAISFDRSSEEISRSFKRGEIDWIGDPCTYDAKIPNPYFAKKPSYPFSIYLNTKFFPLSSRFIRQALSCVLNRRLITQSIFPKSQPFFFHLPVTSSHFEPKLADNALTKGQELFELGLKELGLKAETFPPLKLSSCHFKKNTNLAKYLKKKWELAFGIKVDIEVKDWNTFYQKVEQGSFHIGGCFRCLFPFDPISFLEGFSYQRNNFSQWEHKDYTQIMDLIKKTTSKRDKTRYLSQAKQFLLNHMPIIPLFTPAYSYAHCQGLKDYVLSQDGSIEFRFASIQSRRSEDLDSPADQNKPLLNLSDSRDIAPD